MHTFYHQATSRKEIIMSEFELLNKFIEAYEEDLIQAFFEKKIGQKNNYKELIKSFFEISEIIISNAKRGYPQYTFWGKSNVPKKIISFFESNGFTYEEYKTRYGGKNKRISWNKEPNSYDTQRNLAEELYDLTYKFAKFYSDKNISELVSLGYTNDVYNIYLRYFPELERYYLNKHYSIIPAKLSKEDSKEDKCVSWAKMNK